MDLSIILKYLTGLRENNDREWYHAHKAEYKAANAEFEALLQALILRIGEFDPSVLQNLPQTLTFKLNRDTRFSHDKSPYNPAFRAHISAQGKQPVPVGYYLMLKPDGQFFFGFTITAMLGGMIYGCVFYQEKCTILRTIIAKGLVSLFLNCILNTFWLSILYGQPFTASLAIRVTKNVIALPFEVILLYIVLKGMDQVIKRAKLH